MLVIRLQRTGRKGHAQFRVIVQDSRLNPSSGKVVAQLGSYNPHTKTTIIDKEKASFYLEHGAQPSERAAFLLKTEGVKLPSWVSEATKKAGTTRNPEKLRKNRPAEEAPAESKPAKETPADEATESAAASDEAAAEVPAEEPAADESAAEESEEKTAA
jgi:small subunit ribosomal protein S16